MGLVKKRGGWEKGVRLTDWLGSYLFSSRRVERVHKWTG